LAAGRAFDGWHEEDEPNVAHPRDPFHRIDVLTSATVGGQVIPDIAWTYQAPRHDAARVGGLMAFFDERVDVVVDGERRERPLTPWTSGSRA